MSFNHAFVLVTFFDFLIFCDHIHFGRFAAALIENKLDCWVMNVVPVSGPNTLPVIYDRGLLGVMHDWYKSPSSFFLFFYGKNISST